MAPEMSTAQHSGVEMVRTGPDARRKGESVG